jgi:hypothetical protein
LKEEIVKPKVELTKSYEELVALVKTSVEDIRRKKEKQQVEGIAHSLKYLNQEIIRSTLGSICQTKAGEKPDTDRDKKVVIRSMLEVFLEIYELIIYYYCKQGRTTSDLGVVSEGMNLLKQLIVSCRFANYDIFRIDGKVLFFLQITAQAQKNMEDNYNEEAIAQAVLEKTIFTAGLQILARLLRTWEGPLDQDCIALLEHILNSANVNTLYKLVDFFSNILLETPDKNLFQNLQEHHSSIEESKTYFIEAIAVKATNFLKLLLKSMVSFTEVMQTLFKTKTAEEFATVLQNLSLERRIDEASIELKMPTHMPSLEAYQMMYNRLEFTKLHNMVNYFIGASIFNENLFVVNTLLASKRKQFFKNILTKINVCQKILHPIYDVYFDERLDRNQNWSDETSTSQSSNLESIRILFLRVCMNYCDGDSHTKANEMFINHHDKLCFAQLLRPFLKEGYETMTQHQLHQKMFNYCRKSEPVESVLNYKIVDENVALLMRKPFEEMQMEKSGIVVKLLHKLYTAPKNSSYIFAICTFFETYLRGVNPFMQVFFALGGLLDNLLVQQVKEHDQNSKMITQIYFDLLGEMVKYNTFTLSGMDSILIVRSLPLQFEQLINKNLVDSNVFVRSCLLTDFYHQELGNTSTGSEQPELGSPMLKSVKRDIKKTCKELIESVTPKNISYENLCCVNTVFIISLLSSNRTNPNDPVSHFFEDQCSDEQLHNFKNVMQIWESYYTYKTREMFKLETSTCLKVQNLFDVKKHFSSRIDSKLGKMAEEEISPRH